MDATWIAVVAGTVLVVVIGSLVLMRQGHPEDAADHEHPGEDDLGMGPTGEPYPPGARPAGPDAEAMDSPEAGEPPVPREPDAEPPA